MLSLLFLQGWFVAFAGTEVSPEPAAKPPVSEAKFLEAVEKGQQSLDKLIASAMEASPDLKPAAKPPATKHSSSVEATLFGIVESAETTALETKLLGLLDKAELSAGERERAVLLIPLALHGRAKLPEPAAEPAAAAKLARLLSTVELSSKLLALLDKAKLSAEERERASLLFSALRSQAELPTEESALASDAKLPTEEPPLEADAEFSALEPGLGWVLLQTLLVLLGVMLLAYILLGWGGKYLLKLRATGGQRVISIVERIPVDARKSLLLVKVAKDYFLLSSGERALTVLSKLGAEEVEQALSNNKPAVEPSLFLKKLLERKTTKKPLNEGES